ncbi:hypothetical protein BDF22DRAFT_689985 [Syncephalis plumigaleata]|nr:hypothetical protein BDF22DRAFT_689985 [Syncephalis plumigaleata]
MNSDHPSSHVQCITTVSGYECGNIHVLYNLSVATLVITTITLVLALSIIIYRWYYGLFTSLFRRIDGYWMPKPVDILLVGWCTEKLLRTCVYTIDVLGAKEDSPISRQILYLIATTLLRLAMVHFVVGIITYIPSTRRGVNYSLQSASIYRHSTAARFSYQLCVPSTRVLHWTNVVYSAFWVLFTLVVGINITIYHVQRNTDAAITANRILADASHINFSVILLVSGYYCFGFYRIMRAHACHASSLRMVKSEEAVAARNFRNIFLGILSLPAISLLVAIIRYTVVFHIVTRHIVIYNVIQWIVFFFILRNSRNQVLRKSTFDRISKAISNSRKNLPVYGDTIIISDNYISDSTLIWQSFGASSSHDDCYTSEPIRHNVDYRENVPLASPASSYNLEPGPYQARAVCRDSTITGIHATHRYGSSIKRN